MGRRQLGASVFESNQCGIETEIRKLCTFEKAALNRTNVELKHKVVKLAAALVWALNRTNVELKHSR